MELSKRFHAVATRRLELLGSEHTVMLRGDASALAQPALWEALYRDRQGDVPPREDDGRPQFDFIMTSPPYFNMLRKSRGGVDSALKKRARAGLDTDYGNDRRDLGNINEYDDYIEAMGAVFDQAALLLKPLRYLVIVVQNLRDTDGEVRPLAWDLQRRVSRTLSFQGERIWCQNSKPLGIWGYPKVFVPNYHHHYCLIFRKRQGLEPRQAVAGAGFHRLRVMLSRSTATVATAGGALWRRR